MSIWLARMVRGVITAVVVAAAASGCTGTSQPYVFVSDEFNRSKDGFGQPPKDLARIDICYRARTTGWGEIQAMAVETCGRYGKKAVPQSRVFLSCPLDTPTMARFLCE